VVLVVSRAPGHVALRYGRPTGLDAGGELRQLLTAASRGASKQASDHSLSYAILRDTYSTRVLELE